MKRRTAIKGISAMTASMILFSNCSDGLELVIEEGMDLRFSRSQSNWLDAIAEAILPKSDLALTTLETFPDFVTKMIPFNKSEEEQSAFISGYNHCTEDIKTIYDTAASKVTADQIISYFKDQLGDKKGIVSTSGDQDPIVIKAKEDKKSFCQDIRNLAIQHLTTSKEYQEEMLEYKLVPGSFEACTAI